MHTDTLAFFSPLFLSVACFLASGVWIMLWSLQRLPYMLLSAVPWWGLCVYFGMLAVSAGSAPVVTRADIALGVREWGIVLGVLILAGKALLLAAWWRNGNTRRGSAS